MHFSNCVFLFKIGNSYGYTQTNFENDITLAKNAGIDGFALNVGDDDWTWTRVDWAYAAANSVGGGFKLFISFGILLSKRVYA